MQGAFTCSPPNQLTSCLIRTNSVSHRSTFISLIRTSPATKTLYQINPTSARYQVTGYVSRSRRRLATGPCMFHGRTNYPLRSVVSQENSAISNSKLYSECAVITDSLQSTPYSNSRLSVAHPIRILNNSEVVPGSAFKRSMPKFSSARVSRFFSAVGVQAGYSFHPSPSPSCDMSKTISWHQDPFSLYPGRQSIDGDFTQGGDLRRLSGFLRKRTWLSVA